MTNIKDKLTNVIAVVIAIIGAVQAVAQAVQGHLNSVQDVNWLNLLVVVGVTLVAWFTGKDSDGKTKDL